MFNQAEEVVDEVFVGDPPEPGTVVGPLAGILVLDRPEPPCQPVEHQGVSPVGRGDAGDPDQRRTLAQYPVGHAVPGPGPGRDRRGLVIPLHFLANRSRGLAAGNRSRPAGVGRLDGFTGG